MGICGFITQFYQIISDKCGFPCLIVRRESAILNDTDAVKPLKGHVDRLAAEKARKQIILYHEAAEVSIRKTILLHCARAAKKGIILNITSCMQQMAR